MPETADPPRLVANVGSIMSVVTKRDPITNEPTEKETIMVEFGQPIPADVEPDEIERLSLLGAIGEPGQTREQLEAEQQAKRAAYEAARSSIPPELRW